MAIFPELLCDQRNGEESFAKCGKNLKVDQVTVGKKLLNKNTPVPSIN